MGKGRGLRAVMMAWMVGDIASLDMCRSVDGAVTAGD